MLFFQETSSDGYTYAVKAMDPEGKGGYSLEQLLLLLLLLLLFSFNDPVEKQHKSNAVEEQYNSTLHGLMSFFHQIKTT